MKRASPQKGKGAGIKFLREHIAFDGPECLIWPLTRIKPHGYGALGFNGKLYRAHRLMCELVHGPAPTPAYHAAHSCGNGHLGCVHPKHLSWKTASENQADSVAHGTAHHSGPRAKLTAEKVAAIRANVDGKSQVELAEIYGVRHETISKIHRGILWQDRPSRLGRTLPPQERLRMSRRAKEMLAAGRPLSDIAKELDTTPKTAKALAAECN